VRGTTALSLNKQNCVDEAKSKIVPSSSNKIHRQYESIYLHDPGLEFAETSSKSTSTSLDQ
jgi:hypothetical protein